MIEVVFSSRVSLLAFYSLEGFKPTNGSLTEEKLVLQRQLIWACEKHSLLTEYKRVLIQPGERRRNQLRNKSNANQKHASLEMFKTFYSTLD